MTEPIEGDQDSEVDPPDVSSWLLSFLAVRRREYEEQYAPADAGLERALAAMGRHALDLVATGVIPEALADVLREYRPGDPASHTVRDLLRTQIAQHQLEFDVAEDVCARLHKLDERVSTVAILTILLDGYRPSLTALKYFRRATTLYLAGYDAESVIMAGAVLEAALAERFPDDALRAAGLRPTYARANTYAVGQRLGYGERTGLLTSEHVASIRPVLNWRNDAVHLQPDVAGNPATALWHLAFVLPALFPGPEGAPRDG